jgi:hypothetical protein
MQALQGCTPSHRSPASGTRRQAGVCTGLWTQGGALADAPCAAPHAALGLAGCACPSFASAPGQAPHTERSGYNVEPAPPPHTDRVVAWTQARPHRRPGRARPGSRRAGLELGAAQAQARRQLHPARAEARALRVVALLRDASFRQRHHEEDVVAPVVPADILAPVAARACALARGGLAPGSASLDCSALLGRSELAPFFFFFLLTSEASRAVRDPNDTHDATWRSPCCAAPVSKRGHPACPLSRSGTPRHARMRASEQSSSMSGTHGGAARSPAAPTVQLICAVGKAMGPKAGLRADHETIQCQGRARAPIMEYATVPATPHRQTVRAVAGLPARSVAVRSTNCSAPCAQRRTSAPRAAHTPSALGALACFVRRVAVLPCSVTASEAGTCVRSSPAGTTCCVLHGKQLALQYAPAHCAPARLVRAAGTAQLLRHAQLSHTDTDQPC